MLEMIIMIGVIVCVICAITTILGWARCNPTFKGIIISLIFGIVDDAARRQFTEVLLIIGRKMGKTLLVAAIAGGNGACKVFAHGDPPDGHTYSIYIIA